MLIECDDTHKNEFIKYIGNDYSKCLYIYINMYKYGMSNNEVLTYISMTNSINMIFYNYRNGLHIYSKGKNYNLEDMLNAIKSTKASIICAERNIIEFLERNIDGEYSVEYGFIKKLHNNKLQKSTRVRVATLDDVHSIATLVFQDENLRKGYTFKEIYAQIYNRMYDNFSRNYIIEMGDAIIAQASTGGECKDVAVVNNVIVDSRHRNKGYGYEVVTSICSDLIKDKEVYLVCYTHEAVSLYNKIGFQTCEEWGKIILKSPLM